MSQPCDLTDERKMDLSCLRLHHENEEDVMTILFLSVKMQQYMSEALLTKGYSPEGISDHVRMKMTEKLVGKKIPYSEKVITQEMCDFLYAIVNKRGIAEYLFL